MIFFKSAKAGKRRHCKQGEKEEVAEIPILKWFQKSVLWEKVTLGIHDVAFLGFNPERTKLKTPI